MNSLSPDPHPVPSRIAVVPRVSVVLCTYNGERYLPAFLESLANQSMPVSRLVLRDDGSTDQSENIVRHWAERHRVQVHQVHEPAYRLGPARSFLAALASAGPATVHLLADQDDVWLPTKVERAVNAIQAAPPRPTLYASRVEIVDSSLFPISVSPLPVNLSFRSAFCESQLTGCTMALNEELRLLSARGEAKAVLMHDWWLYMLASAVGTIIFDDHPTLLYRQHGQNAVGAEKNGVAAWIKRVRKAVGGPSGTRSAQLREFGWMFGDILPHEVKAMVDALASSKATWWRRWHVALTIPIARRTWLDRVGTRVAIMRNRF